MSEEDLPKIQPFPRGYHLLLRVEGNDWERLNLGEIYTAEGAKKHYWNAVREHGEVNVALVRSVGVQIQTKLKLEGEEEEK